MALKGEDGGLRKMLKTQGYEKSLLKFSKLAADTNAFGLAGLKGTEPKDAKEFLDLDGRKKAAKALMTFTSKLAPPQSQKRLVFEKSNEIEENHQKTDLDRPLNTSENDKPMTMQF